MAKKLTANKAREILHDKSVHGHPLTDKQRKFFGAIAGGAPVKQKTGGWLDHYEEGGAESRMGGLTDIPFDYNSAWGGQFEDGGNIPQGQDGILTNIYSKWPALKHLGNVTVKPDESFTREKTGMGDIEFFSPDLPQVSYPNGYVAQHPGPGTYGILYNPTTNDEQNIRLDMLHGMTEADPKYKRLRNRFERAVKHSDIYDEMNHWYNIDKEKGNAEDGRERWMDNYTDGQLRTLLFEGDRSKQNYSDEEANQLLSHPRIKRKFDKLNNYLQKGEFGGSIPGSVGFTYARTGEIPSNGPYAKKTKASAQNGMTFYQHGLDWKPKTISKKGSVIKDNRGQWAHPGKITEIDSNNITMQGVPYDVLGIGADGQRIMMQPGQDYKFNKGPVTEIPMKKEGGPEPIRRPDPRYGQPTSADSLKVYNNAMAIRQYYEGLKNKGWYQAKPYITNLTGLSPGYIKERMENVKQGSLDTYRRNLKEKDKGYAYQYFKNAYPNKTSDDYYRAVAQSMKDTKSGTDRFYYYKDLLPSVIDPMAPSTLVDLNILPTQDITFYAKGRGNLARIPPGGAITRIFGYDPFEVKPWNMKTPAERKEWLKRHPEVKQQSTSSPKPQPKSTQKNPTIRYGNTTGRMDGDTFIVDKPKPQPTLQRIPFSPETLSVSPRTVNLPQISPINLPQAQSPEWQYRVEYTDPETGKETHRMFNTEKEGSQFQGMIEGNRKGYWEKQPKKKNGGWLDKYK